MHQRRWRKTVATKITQTTQLGETPKWACKHFWVDDWISSHFLVSKFCQESSKDVCCVREASVKETSWSRTLMSWKMLTRPKSMFGYSNAKEVLMPKNGGHFIFLVADGTFKLSGRDQVFRRTTSIQDHPARGEEHSDGLQRDSYGSQPLDTLTGDGEVRNDCWMIAGIFCRHHFQPKS